MGKGLIIFVFLLTNVFCKSVDFSDGLEKIKIEAVEVNKIDEYNFIYFSRNDVISLLISKKTPNEDCQDKLAPGRIVEVNLDKIFAIELSEDISWRLYSNDLYIDEKLILEKETLVFTSQNVSGSCFIKK